MLSLPAVYETFQNVMGAARARRTFAERFIRAKPGDRFLDIGCGAGKIVTCLPPGVDYLGYDVSQAYIDKARSAYGQRGAFVCGRFDGAACRGLAPFDLVTAGGLLHHLDDEAAGGLAKAVLAPAGRVLTWDACYAPGQSPIARFLIAHDRGQNVRDSEAISRSPSRSSLTSAASCCTAAGFPIPTGSCSAGREPRRGGRFLVRAGEFAHSAGADARDARLGLDGR